MCKKEIKIFKIIAALMGFVFYAQNCFAQQPTVKTFVDKNNILIGEQINYKITATFPNGIYKVNWPMPPDTLAHFEIVDKSKIDTTSANNNITLEQTLTLTSFDSGRWNTPAFNINFNPIKDDTTINLFTDSILINVGYAAVDSTHQLRDIKPIIEVSVKNYLGYYIGGAIVLLLALAFILWRYFKTKKKKPLQNVSSKLSPYDEAIQNLEKLKILNLQMPEEIKKYHATLSEIFRGYISRKNRLSIMNKTTGDVLMYLTENNFPKDTVVNVATVLRCSDAVKFAQFLPTVSESQECQIKIKETINFIHSSHTKNQ